LAERKAQFAQELSASSMEAENNRKAADEAVLRAEAAEEYQRAAQVKSMFFEIAFRLLLTIW
jgi:hypothetical protein